MKKQAIGAFFLAFATLFATIVLPTMPVRGQQGTTSGIRRVLLLPSTCAPGQVVLVFLGGMHVCTASNAWRLLSSTSIDVTDLGAVCDSSTDDHVAMQATIDAAQVVSSNNSISAVTSPQGKTCIFGSDLTLASIGTSNIDIGAQTGPSTSAGAGMIWASKGGAKININPSVLGNGLGVRLHNFTLNCNFDYTSTDTCATLVKVGNSSSFGSTFGPIMIDHMTMNGHHLATSGDGSHGGANAITCASHCSLQVKIADNNIENFSGTLVDMANSANSGGTSVEVSNNQFFDAPKGIKVSSSGPISIHGNYSELITHAIEITNDVSWTLGQYDIYGNECNLENIPPLNNETSTGAQRCLYITNQDGGVSTMTALVHFHDNKVNVSAGYVTGAQGLAPYAVETNLACAGFCYSVIIDSHDNYYAGMTVSAIHANLAFGWVTSHNDLVTSDLNVYEPASNLPAITGNYVGNPGFYDPNSDSAVSAAFLLARTNFTTPVAQACALATDQKACAASSGYLQLNRGDTTHLGGWQLYDNSLSPKAACGFGGDLVATGINTFACSNSFRANFLNIALLQSNTANSAAAGLFRMANTDVLSWRNNANGADLAFGVDTSDRIAYNGHPFVDSSNNGLFGNVTATGTIRANTAFNFNGTVGFTGSKLAGSCTLVISGGIITNVTGC